ncbi:hypothetical protein LMG28614_01884 [Paraburkholderia ultramafica]|uniref:Uncharacterized protein n=1 Tax=Paraburkholderia ultramafica TaxID=1544867 RepID=A0A6S7CNQ5_9BURK|nr:hypothetical protein LMG28614_01884 [Paraburkholderia ultramafica]
MRRSRQVSLEYDRHNFGVRSQASAVNHGNHIQGGPMHPGRHWVLLLSVVAFGSTGAWASDIQCATTRQLAERVICDHAILNNEYDDIFAQQQALLRSGKLSPEQLARWRQARSACTDVHCIDGVFARWAAMAKSVKAVATPARAPAMASSTDMAPVGPPSDAVPSVALQASPTSEASLVRQGSAAGVALPQPVAMQASAPAVASAASSPSDSRNPIGMSASLMVALFVAIGFGVLFRRRKK